MDKSVQKRERGWLLGLSLPSRWGLSISALCLLASLMSVVAVVILRYLLNEPSIALQDLSLWLHAAAFMLAIPAALQHDQHVRVDIWYRRWHPKTQGMVDVVGTLVFLFPLAVFLIVSSWDSVVLSWRLQEASPETGGLPGLFLLKTLVLVMPLMLIIQGAAFLIDAWRKMRGLEPASHASPTEL